MGLAFEVSAGCSTGGRRAALHLPHGTVETPVFMPVGTAATVKTVQQETLEHIGADGAGARIILANTYHLYLRPGHELIRRMGGVHRFMSWNRPMLTDSGGFQVFSLAKLRKITDAGVEFRSHLDGSTHFFSPEHSMEVQIALGADVMMAFDECVETPATWERTRDSMGLTHAWAARSKAYFDAHQHEVPWAAAFPGRTQSLFGIVQGGMYANLRRESAERLAEMDFDGYAIGGLAVGEPREVTREMIARTLEILPEDKPRYVMGVGYPDEIEEYARMGVDMMDCVLPSRNARNGYLFTSRGRVIIKHARYKDDERPIDENCRCYTCSRYSRSYLRHLFLSGEILYASLATRHNVRRYLDIMGEIRHAIISFSFPEYLRCVRSAALEAE